MQDRIPLGDTLNFPTTVPDYLASDGWTLRYRLIPRTVGGAAIDLLAITDPDNADGYAVQESAATTAAWAAGEYSWASWVSKGAEVYSLGSGTCTLLPDPRTAVGGHDGRTSAAIALDNVTATLQGRATSAVLEYEIAGRRLKYIPVADLIALESKLQTAVAAEQRVVDMAKGYPDRRKVYVRMSGA